MTGPGAPTANTAFELEWQANTDVARTILEDSFKSGWEDVVFELINNAIQADASVVDIECPKSDMPPHAERFFRITDNGNGMTPAELQAHFCVMGNTHIERPSTIFPGRGTGRLACFVVAGILDIMTTSNGHVSRAVIDAGFIWAPSGGRPKKLVADKWLDPNAPKGTTITLTEFNQSLTIPSETLVGRSVLRRFVRPPVLVRINGKPYDPTNFALEVDRFEDVYLDGFGSISGAIWYLQDKHFSRVDKWIPGITINAGGQYYFGPSLFGAHNADRTQAYKVTVGRLLGHVDAKLDHPIPLPREWPHDGPYGRAGAWLRDRMEQAAHRQVDTLISARIHAWIDDPRTKDAWDRLDDRQKATAKGLLTRLAHHRLSEHSDIKIITRLLVRCVETATLSRVLDEIAMADKGDIDTLHGMLAGDNPWSVRQVVEASQVVKYRRQALARLDETVRAPETIEADIHKILEANPWIIDDAYASFRSNRQIRTTLRAMGKMVDREDEALDKRPDFVFALKSPLESRFLLVELKGRNWPLERAWQTQATDDVVTFLGEFGPHCTAHVMLIGTHYKANHRVEPKLMGHNYTFEAMRYEDLIDRALSRLAFVSHATEGKEEGVIRRVFEAKERDLADALGLPEPPPGPSPLLPITGVTATPTGKKKRGKR